MHSETRRRTPPPFPAGFPPMALPTVCQAVVLRMLLVALPTVCQAVVLRMLLVALPTVCQAVVLRMLPMALPMVCRAVVLRMLPMALPTVCQAVVLRMLLVALPTVCQAVVLRMLPMALPTVCQAVVLRMLLVALPTVCQAVVLRMLPMALPTVCQAVVLRMLPMALPTVCQAVVLRMLLVELPTIYRWVVLRMVRVIGDGTGVIRVRFMQFLCDDYVVCNCNTNCLDRKLPANLWLVVAAFPFLVISCDGLFVETILSHPHYPEVARQSHCSVWTSSTNNYHIQGPIDPPSCSSVSALTPVPACRRKSITVAMTIRKVRLRAWYYWKLRSN
jgi:hypothetical protein